MDHVPADGCVARSLPELVAVFADAYADRHQHGQFFNGFGMRLGFGADALGHVGGATQADEARLEAELSGEFGVQRIHRGSIVFEGRVL